MKQGIPLIIFAFLLTATLQVRLTHDNKRGYGYQISGPSVEEVIETDQKMRQYLKSLAPKKNAGPAPSVAAPKPAPAKK
jgi:hypothetical protein